jgi:hypothetical protein
MGSHRWGAQDEPETVCPGPELMECSSYSTEFLLWPPGAIACDFTAPGGTVTRYVSFPWTECGSVLLSPLADLHRDRTRPAHRTETLLHYGRGHRPGHPRGRGQSVRAGPGDPAHIHRLIAAGRYARRRTAQAGPREGDSR